MQFARKSVGAVEGGVGSHYLISLSVFTRLVSSLRNIKTSGSCIFLMSLAIMNFGQRRQTSLCSKVHCKLVQGRGLGKSL